jgi:hypothetical protein
MRIIIGNSYYSTPEGSSVRITRSISDPVPTCAVSFCDTTSALNIVAPQEILVLDEQVYPNPTINYLKNPNMNPDTSFWTIGTPAGITTSQVSGGGINITVNNAMNATNPITQQSTDASLVRFQAGEILVFSVYVQGSVGNTNVEAYMALQWFDVNNLPIFGQDTTFTSPAPVPTTLTRYSFQVTPPSTAFFARVQLGVVLTSNTNSGTITFTNAQLEPLWFPTMAYPTPFCGPNQANCQQLPNNPLWIRQYRKFAGFVTHVSLGGYHGNVRTVQVHAVGYAWLAGIIIGNDTFSGQADSTIISSLLSRYLTNSGTNLCSITNVVTGVTLSSYQLNWDDLRTAFDGLCGQSTFYWTIDYYWNFIYLPPGYISMPISLICDTSSQPDMVTTFPAYNFSSENDFTQPGSNILVLGNGSNTAQVIDPSQVANLGRISGYVFPSTTSWMRKVNDSTLASVSDCTQRGMAELIQYDNPRSLYHLTTNVELVAGESIRVTSKTDGLNQTTLLLQQVTAQWIGTSETLTDVWEYQADLGAVNRAATNIISRIFRQTQKNTSAPAISTTTLAVLETLGVVDTLDGNSSYAQAVLADSPAAYWRLGEPAGFGITSAYDWGGTTQTGTYTGGVTLGQAGALYNDSNTAVAFNGSTSYVSLPNGIVASNHDFSIELWAFITSFATDGGGIERRLFVANSDNINGFQLALQASNTALVFAANDSTGQVITSKLGWSLNTWYHLVGTWIAGTRTATLYVNGVAQVNDGGASGYGMGSIATNIARRTDSTGYFPGTLDEVAVYSTALSAARILAHYNIGTFGHA